MRGGIKEREIKRERGNNEIKFLTQLIRDRAKVKWSKRMEKYSIGFKVLTSSEQIGDPLEKYSYNHDISPYYPLFKKYFIYLFF